MHEIFENLSPAERAQAQTCLGLRRRRVAAGQLLFREGEPARSFGIILSGSVNVVRYSLDGRARMLTHLVAGESFGTSFALGGGKRHFANIEANENSDVLLLDAARLLAPCSRRCALHMHLLTHLLGALAERNIALARKIDCLSQRSTADKLLAYLRLRAEAAGTDAFTIPFTRQQLADYLNVDRAALSTEISRLVRAGAIETRRNFFRLKTAVG